MSSKRKHRPTSTSSERRSSSRPEDERQDTNGPEPKRSRKEESIPAAEKAPKFCPPTKENGGTLGGLPLYGERLPGDGYAYIPIATKKACEELRQVMSTVKELKSKPNGKSTNEEVASQRKVGALLFAQLRHLNRLSNLYCKDTRDKTQEKKQSVDELHLQLQNLQYEAKHLHKEITSCLEFKSKHEEIDLISEEEFLETAPESLTNPVKDRSDPHKLMLARLEWELKQREQLNSRQSSLEVSIKSKLAQTQKLEEKLSGLLPSLEQLRTATLPLQEFFDIPLDWEREQHHLATMLPRPLYLMYIQAEGYNKSEDSLIKVVVNGDIEEAKSFMVAKEQYGGQDDTDLSDNESESTAKKKKRRKSKAVNEDEPLFRKAFPLSVSLIITVSDFGSVAITFHYLPFFNVICSSTTSINLLQPDAHTSLLIDKNSILHNLFEGDSGKTSPNSSVSLQIRKYGGDNFSSVVRQYGFPYKWVQQICGINIPSDINFSDLNDIKLNPELSVTSLLSVVKAIRCRLKSQCHLMNQLTSLEQLSLPNDQEEGVARLYPASQLTRWKQITSSEVQNSQFGSSDILNVQERSNRFYLATFQLEQARWHTIISLSPSYPATKPVMIVLVEFSEKQRDSFNIKLKDIESDVNVHYPLSLPADKFGEKLLMKQLLRLQHLVDGYIQYRSRSTQFLMTQAIIPRGKARLLSSSLT